MSESKLSPNLAFAFALTALAAAIGLTELIPHITGPISPKAMAAVYFAVFGGGACATALSTRAGALRTIGAFALSGAGLGVYYYVVVARHMAAAGAGVASTMGIVFAAAFAFDALAAGIAGTLFGHRLRRSLAHPALRTR